MRAAVRIRDGLPWVASNTDRTFPAAFGVAPGHGVQVQMLRDFTGVDPVVAGKPERPLLDETVRRVGGRRPLMVGDRLDTDIEGAPQRRVRLAAGADRGHRARRAGRGARGRSGRRTSPPTSAACWRPTAPRRRGRRRGAGRLAGPGRGREPAGRGRRVRRGTGGGWWRRRRGPTWTRPANRWTCPGWRSPPR